jgi:Protein of unknown function (DUF1592)/Protein of unknown function (DUF1588)/Protein of unknown function (DUF1587)/Protein of unknown function (DUF1585)/Protein of unknown function (DUF1595)/Planctomycete cytochrome C
MLMIGNRSILTLIGSAAIACGASGAPHEPPVDPVFQAKIQPLIESYCYDCHADGANKGSVSFDELKGRQDAPENRELWLRVFKNLRAGMMPPQKKSQPSAEEKDLLLSWIKSDVFKLDPLNPDPGRVTIRRLNRVEYRNTVRDLLGIDFDTGDAFPPDDTGHGFDNIADVLTLPPMLLEKYMIAAEKITSEAVPLISSLPAEQTIRGRQFRGGGYSPEGQGQGQGGQGRRSDGVLSLSFYSAATVSNTISTRKAGQYNLGVNLRINERFVDDMFDLNRCRLTFRVDGKELLQKELTWDGGKPIRLDFVEHWQAGDHQLEFQVQPLTPNEAQNRTLAITINSVVIQGPMAKEDWIHPKNHERFFTKAIPQDLADRRVYAREMLSDFARRAFRRPIDGRTEDRLVRLAESVFTQPGKSFEMGIAQGMKAILASPRFIFREEGTEPGKDAKGYALVDEYALAARLSYFFWSSMPDEELFRLASEGHLRKNLSVQVTRMLKDERAEALVKNFTGQWLHARDIETIPIEARSVLAREDKFDPDAEQRRARGRALRNKPPESLTPEEKQELANFVAQFQGNRRRPLRMDLTSDVRRAMRQETEEYFEYILRNDRSLLELIDSNYTFLNEPLARHYGLTNLNVTGTELRRVTLPEGSPRGGILGQGTVLVVTSNPTRTSPVKRGVFILDNILGTPPPPPPPDIPPLEEANKQLSNRAPLLRETLAVHRANPLCSSCHNRMDPLGLAMENFNAMGGWREDEFEQPIDPAGKLITGEAFTTFQELKRVLVEKRSGDFYHTLTEKLLTYALGRGLEYNDVQTVEDIVARLKTAKGQPSVLLMSIVESAPFQKTRIAVKQTTAAQEKKPQPMAARQERELNP